MGTQTVNASEQAAGSGDTEKAILHTLDAEAQLCALLGAGADELIAIDQRTLASRALAAVRETRREIQRGLGVTPAPLVELQTYDASDHFMSGFIQAARMLEIRGDKAHVAFKRDGEGEIVGVVFSVEDR